VEGSRGLKLHVSVSQQHSVAPNTSTVYGEKASWSGNQGGHLAAPPSEFALNYCGSPKPSLEPVVDDEPKVGASPRGSLGPRGEGVPSMGVPGSPEVSAMQLDYDTHETHFSPASATANLIVPTNTNIRGRRRTYVIVAPTTKPDSSAPAGVTTTKLSVSDLIHKNPALSIKEVFRVRRTSKGPEEDEPVGARLNRASSKHRIQSHRSHSFFDLPKAKPAETRYLHFLLASRPTPAHLSMCQESPAYPHANVHAQGREKLCVDSGYDC
jgi:hypothetical protein